MAECACDDKIVFVLARPGVVEIDPKSKQEFRVIVQRPTSVTKSRQKSKSFLPCHTVTSKDLPRDFYFFKLTQPLPISGFQLLCTVKEKKGKPDRKTYPLPYGLRNPYRNLNSENSQDYAQKTQRNCGTLRS